jgi:hypothetical protein
MNMIAHADLPPIAALRRARSITELRASLRLVAESLEISRPERSLLAFFMAFPFLL